jgi:ammonia channel protein AmtB
MEFQDIVFFALVLWMAWEVFNGGSGGGKRRRDPIAAWQPTF